MMQLLSPILLTGLAALLTGCGKNIYEGHYGINFSDIKVGDSVQTITNRIGPPLKFRNIDGVFYYLYSIKKRTQFTTTIVEQKIIRIEHNHGKIVRLKIVELKKFKPTKPHNKKLDIQFNKIEELFTFDQIGVIG